MPDLPIDGLVDEFMNERLDAELSAILGTAKDVIKNSDLVPADEQPDAIIDFLRYLEKQETEWNPSNKEKGRLPPAYRVMKLFIKDNEMELLKLYLKKLIQESKPDVAGRQEWINAHKRRFLPESDTAQPGDLHEKDPHSKVILTITHAMKWALKEVPEIIEKALESRFWPVLDEIVEGFIPNGGCATMLVVSGCYVGLVAITNLACVVFRGRSWSRAIKNVVEEGGSITVGNIVGYSVGVTAGLLFGLPPLAILGIGALVGLAASYVARNYFDSWCLKWFNIPRDEKLEMAYNKLEVKQTDSNSVVNRAYRLKSKACHPDTLARMDPLPPKEEIDEKIEKFLQYQDAIKTIRDARESDGAFAGNGEDRIDEEEICWREKVINFLKRLNPWWASNNKNLKDLLPLTYDFPPISIFEEASVRDGKDD